MEIKDATIIFSTLSQETRLRAFRLLVKAGKAGLAAGKISELLSTPHNTMSFHLNHLAHAGIISSRKDGRSVIYSANFEIIQSLIGFIVKDCCSAEFANIREDSEKGCSVIELAVCCTPDIKVLSTP
ncbi:ArsR/SmtB family transcription factor [Kordiimonas pumila]|uniref:ArsR/SmtB family transcription factor n=1 Tax=Kordiimonas pumila TaxID=2161677 RepID=A0ABV7D3Q7_9PROT|nr:metalloregulator ArsR/SmtB family transcription factor [Kordiimonas pumila]